MDALYLLTWDGGKKLGSGELSLYFGLKPGERADLEVIAAAALEWVEAVRAAAREIAPEAQVRVQIVNASESSLRLNATLDWIEDRLSGIEESTRRYSRTRKLAVALVIFVPTVGVPTYDFYFGEKPAISLKEDDRRLLNELLEKIRQNPEVKEKRQKFFRTLERDPSISSAGVSEGHADRPIVIVPSNQFPERSGLWAALSEEELERKTYPVIDAVLVSPALVSTPRAWKFQPAGLQEFTATMRDKRFLAALEHNSVREKLRNGIPMTLRLEVKEKKVDGAWVLKRGGRSVVEVISPKVD